MARKEMDVLRGSREMRTQEDSDPGGEMEKEEQMDSFNVYDKKTFAAKKLKKSVEAELRNSRDSKVIMPKNIKFVSQSPTTIASPNKRRPCREASGMQKSSDGSFVSRAKSKPSSERNEREFASSPPKTDGAKDLLRETSSTYICSWRTNQSAAIKKDFKSMEEFIYKMSNFHGYICREDVALLLKNSGDWLVRMSVQPQAERKTARTPDRERPSKCKTQRVFVISVHCKGKSAVAGKSNNRNLVVKAKDGMFSIDSVKHFSKLGDLFTHYQNNSAVHKEAEFQLLTPVVLSSWEFHHEDIELQSKKLGEGAFGEVRVGRMSVKDPGKTVTAVDVAVKMLKNTSEAVTRDQVEELLHEARVMRKLDHPNVLRSCGISVLREPLYLMSELCLNGALREYLKENKKTITLTDKLHFVLGSARGVEYLHSQRIIHRDLAVRNILLNEEKIPKVSDFGLAKLTDRYEMKEHCKIPVRYLAPETLELFVFTPKTDVFSFGCVIWEIYENGQQPHDGKNMQTIRALVKKREFLKLSPLAPESLRSLVAEKVFVADPENRCSMAAIVQCVEKAEKLLK